MEDADAGVADLDDEDPDLGDWGDLYANEGDEDDKRDSDSSDSNSIKGSDKKRAVDDEDAFMDDNDDDLSKLATYLRTIVCVEGNVGRLNTKEETPAYLQRGGRVIGRGAWCARRLDAATLC